MEEYLLHRLLPHVEVLRDDGDRPGPPVSDVIEDPTLVIVRGQLGDEVVLIGRQGNDDIRFSAMLSPYL